MIISKNPGIVSNYLRNERAMKAQRKQMNARSLLNIAFQIFYFILFFLYNKDAVSEEASKSWHCSV